MAAGDVVWPVNSMFEFRGTGREAGSMQGEAGPDGSREVIRWGEELKFESYAGLDEEQVHQVVLSPDPERHNLGQFDRSQLKRGDYVQVIGEVKIAARPRPGAPGGSFRLTGLIGPLTPDGQLKGATGGVKGRDATTTSASA